MELKLIFCTILFSYFRDVRATCAKPNEIYSSDANRCESACTYKGLLDYQKNKSACICNIGFVRNNEGNCIEPRLCEKCCEVNEQLDIEAVKKNASCSTFCTCKKGFYRSGKECIECNYPSKHKSRCDVFDSKTCSCTQCKNQYKFCKGRCFNNHLYCRTYDSINTCRCINCETGYKNHEGTCVKDVANCAKYDTSGKCIACKPGKTLCGSNCVSNCIGGQILDLSVCICVCPPNTELCASNCVKPVCDSAFQFFSKQTCKCECKEGAFPCRNSCHPYVNNCAKYNTDTCKCKYCNPGFKLCNNQCVDYKCNVNEYFVDAICQCDCKEGFFKNEKGVCHSTENCIEPSIFQKLFLEIVYNFLPAGYGFCHVNEYYSSWAIKYEETCQRPRKPNSLERCFCKTGYIRDIRTNTCVKVCPLPGDPCKTHEIYECGPERYCGNTVGKSLVKIGESARLAYIEVDAIDAGQTKNKPQQVDEEIVEIDVDIDQSSNENSQIDRAQKDRNKKIDSESGIVDVSVSVEEIVSLEVEIGDDSKESESKESKVLDVSASIKELASVDVEIGDDSNESKSKESELLDVNVSIIDELASVDVEIGNDSKPQITTSPPTDLPNTETPIDTPSTEVNVEGEIINEEFCGYHCQEGYGRFKSVCKKCDIL